MSIEFSSYCLFPKTNQTRSRLVLFGSSRVPALQNYLCRLGHFFIIQKLLDMSYQAPTSSGSGGSSLVRSHLQYLESFIINSQQLFPSEISYDFDQLFKTQQVPKNLTYTLKQCRYKSRITSLESSHLISQIFQQLVSRFSLICFLIHFLDHCATSLYEISLFFIVNHSFLIRENFILLPLQSNPKFDFLNTCVIPSVFLTRVLFLVL